MCREQRWRVLPFDRTGGLSASDLRRYSAFIFGLGLKEATINISINYMIRFSVCVASDDPRVRNSIVLPQTAAPTPAPRKPDADTGKFGFRITIEPDGIIRYTPGRPIVAVVRLNGRSSARLILDTGADGSMVKPELLAAAGVDLSRPAARGEASGVTGKVTVSYFPVDFEVAGHRARVPRVAAFNNENDIADGLLGRDFLDRFKVVMDPASGTVTLTPK